MTDSDPGRPCGHIHPTNEHGYTYCNLQPDHPGPHWPITTDIT